MNAFGMDRPIVQHQKFLENIRRKRAADEREFDEYFFQKRSESVDDVIVAAVSAAVMLGRSPERTPKWPNVARDHSWWTNGYQTWTEEEFKKRLRIKRETFEYIIGEIRLDIQKEPTNFKPNPTSVDRQLANTLYRLAHGCSFSTLSDLFGVSISSASETFNYVCRVLVSRLYDRHVRLPETEEELEKEIRGFIENYEFPCIGAWDGFHVYVSTKLKNYYSFKKR